MTNPAQPKDVEEEGHLSRLAMARLLAGDLDDRARTDSEKHIHACAACAAMHREALAVAQSFAEKYPTQESLAAKSRPSAVPVRTGRAFLGRSWWAPFRGLLGREARLRPKLVFALAILLAGTMFWYFPVGQNQDLFPKGGTSYFLILNGQPMLEDTVACGPGDTLQLGLIAPAPVYYAVLYRDDGGPIRTYMGVEGGVQKPLGSPQGENLPHSLILGAGWERENLFCVWSPRPVSAAKAIDRASSDRNDPKIHIYYLVNRRP